MPGIGTVLDIGRWALFGSQAAIETTGNNIANANTVGYSRRYVVFEEKTSIDYRPGQIGTGVEATQIVRSFDMFIEAQYNDMATMRDRYDELWTDLKSVDSLFNESNGYGISSSLDTFFNYWQDLSLRPDDYATREALISNTQNLATLLRNADSDLATMQQQAGEAAAAEVDDINALLEAITDINKQLNAHDIPGVNNANALLDERDTLVRELATKIDVTVLDKGNANSSLSNVLSVGEDWALVTTSGKTLVQGTEYFRLAYEGPQAFASLTNESTFDGEIQFDGESDFEYTVEILQGGDVASDGSAAVFRVSLDGGQTWVKDENGNERHFYARPESHKVDVMGVDIWFDNATQPLSAGDTFSIVPKNGVYWYQTASHKENITPQILADGSDDPTRLVGGSLTALMNFSDQYVGTYRDQLDAMSEALIWEVNRLHSQGAGLTMIADTLGTYSVNNTDVALGSDSSGLHWSSRLESGNVMVYMFDADQNHTLSCASFGPLDFDPATAGIQNFDPSVHTLEDVRDAFNRIDHLSATIENNQLRLTTDSGYQVGFGADTSGLLAGLGINTYFSGTGVGDIGVNSDILYDSKRLNAGHINGAGEYNDGDNGTALDIADLKDKSVTIVSSFSAGSNQSILDYYSSIVARVGADTASAEFQYSYTKSLADDLNSQQQAVSGVNLDEEMTNLVKYQHSYRAAAKLITTADEMLQTVLALKQ